MSKYAETVTLNDGFRVGTVIESGDGTKRVVSVLSENGAIETRVYRLSDIRKKALSVCVQRGSYD